jgi:hypothetical protein
MGSGSFGGGHHFVGGHIGGMYGYSEDWMARTKKTIEDELRCRGIEPEVINEVVSKVEEPSHVMPVLLAIVTTAVICTLIFAVVWERTPR